jgi:NADPH2:quinone reductase
VQRAEQALFAMYEKGRLKPHIMATYPIEKYREALTVVRDRGVLGKVVMVV